MPSVTSSVAIVLVCAALLPACGGSERPAEKPAPGNPGSALAAKMESLAESVASGADSCDAFADALGGWVDREGDGARSLAAELDRTSDSITDAELARLQERLAAALEVIDTRAAECGDHAGARDARKRFDAVLGLQ